MYKRNIIIKLDGLYLINFTKHLEEWKKSDPKLLVKIISLIAEIAVDPFQGTGKPEPLKHELKGKWSRRINQEHRIVYEVKENSIWIISCKYHYE